MRNDHTIAVIIPALNEEASIGKVIRDIPAWVDDIIVVDNGSTDSTARVAAEHGARVIAEPRRGYGAACLRGIAVLNAPDLVVFLGGGYREHPEEMPLLVDPVIQGEVDFMVGSRADTPGATAGNWLATKLIRLFWGIRYTDLGPFRAIRYRTLLQLAMAEGGSVWNVEMQIKAALHAVPADEVPVSWRPGEKRPHASRGGSAALLANFKIVGTILLNALFSSYHLKTGLLTYFVPFSEATGSAHPLSSQSLEVETIVAQSIPPLREVETAIRYAQAERRAMRAWLGPEHLYTPQGEGDPGERVTRALEEGFHQAYGKVVLCGCDCPELSQRHTGDAFRALDTTDLVLGPTSHGGFYLIGLGMLGAPEELADLFKNVEWGTDLVREQILANAEELGLSMEMLETLMVAG